MRDLSSGKELTQSQAIAYLNDYKEAFESLNPNNHLLLVDDMSCGNGTTNSFNKRYLRVGTYGIDSDSDEPVNTVDFTACVVAVNHEMRHCEQYTSLMHGTSIRERAFAYDYKISDTSPSFYKTNYKDNPRELDAELYGLKKAYVFLEKHFGEKNANDLLCQYQSYREKHGRPYVRHKIGKPYNNCLKLMDDIEAKLKTSVRTKKKYPLLNNHDKHDSLSVMFAKYPNDLRLFRKLDDGLLQLKFGAALTREHIGLADGDAMAVCVLDANDVRNEIDKYLKEQSLDEKQPPQNTQSIDDEYY